MPKVAFGCIVIDADRDSIIKMKKHIETLMIKSLKITEKTSQNILKCSKQMITNLLQKKTHNMKLKILILK